MYQQFLQTIIPMLPEAIVITVALTVLLFDLFVEKDRKFVLGWYSLAGILIAAYVSYD